MLRVENARKEYGLRIILNNVSFTAEHGSIVGIVGQHGAGKTTLLQILSAAIPLSSGSITLNGVNATSQESEYSHNVTCYHDRQSILYQNMTVHDSLVYACYMKDIPAGEIDERTMFVMRKMGIDGFRATKVSALPREACVKVILALLVLGNPTLILLDDVFMRENRMEQLLFREFVERAKMRKCIVIIAASDEKQTGLICDDILYLEGGTISRKERR